MKSEQTKNHTGTTNENEGDGGRMYEIGGIKCPVISFEKYLSKRNKKSGTLFQYPKSTFTDDEEEWYENRAMGKNAIGNFMSVLSKKANLSEEYTNHCIHATTITELDRYGPSLSNSTTTLSDIYFLDIDDNLLLETLMQIEKQPLQTQSN